MEHVVLTSLLLRRGEVIGYGEMIELMYPNPDEEPDWARSSLGAVICRIRAKLPGAIHTIRASGFYIPVAIVT
jgi:hypothetical protein